MSSRAQPPLVQLLLEHGADVSLTDEKGCSALMCAALRLASDLRLNWRSRVTADTLAKAMMAHEANKAAQEVTRWWFPLHLDGAIWTQIQQRIRVWVCGVYPTCRRPCLLR